MAKKRSPSTPALPVQGSGLLAFVEAVRSAPLAPTAAQKRAAAREKKAAREQEILTTSKDAIMEAHQKGYSIAVIRATLCKAFGDVISAAAIRAFIQSPSAKKSQPAPQTPSPAEQMSPQGSPAAAPRVDVSSNAARKSN